MTVIKEVMLRMERRRKESPSLPAESTFGSEPKIAQAVLDISSHLPKAQIRNPNPTLSPKSVSPTKDVPSPFPWISCNPSIPGGCVARSQGTPTPKFPPIPRLVSVLCRALVPGFGLDPHEPQQYSRLSDPETLRQFEIRGHGCI
jgi:hypothetical protein